MDESLLIDLAPPRVENGKALRIAGLSGRYNQETCVDIPALWQRFAPYIGRIPGQIGRVTFGVIYTLDREGHIEYTSGVEVSDFSGVAPELRTLEIPAQQYAVFTQRQHISTIRRTWYTIANRGLRESGFTPSGGPDLERYGEGFDPLTGNGGFEIWIPVRTTPPTAS